MHNMASREFQDLLRFVPNQEVGSGVDNDSAARQNCHNDIRIRQLVVVRYKHIFRACALRTYQLCVSFSNPKTS